MIPYSCVIVLVGKICKNVWSVEHLLWNALIACNISACFLPVATLLYLRVLSTVHHLCCCATMALGMTPMHSIIPLHEEEHAVRVIWEVPSKRTSFCGEFFVVPKISQNLSIWGTGTKGFVQLRLRSPQPLVCFLWWKKCQIYFFLIMWSSRDLSSVVEKSDVRHHHRSISIRFYGDRLTLDTLYLTFFDHGIFGKGFAACPKEHAFNANHTNAVSAL